MGHILHTSDNPQTKLSVIYRLLQVRSGVMDGFITRVTELDSRRVLLCKDPFHVSTRAIVSGVALGEARVKSERYASMEVF